MSFGSRLYQIFRAPVDFGVQATDLFVDTIRLASDEEYSTFEAFNESWKDNVMGRISASNEGVVGRSVLGSFFGPDSGLGAIVGAIPEDVRERPASVWNLTMDGYTYAYKNFVDRPIGFMVSMGSLSPLQSRDPNTGMVDGRGFNTKIFEYDTYKNVWDLTEDRSGGQAMLMFSGNVDILNKQSVLEFKQTPKYQLVSGIFDAGLNVVGDPGWVTAKSFRTIRNIRNAQTNRLRSGSDQLFPEEVVEYIDIDGSGNAIPVTRIEDGVMPNESMGPFYQPVRQPVRNQPIIVRTPNKRPIRIGGQKLHEKIQQFEGQYPLLERLLGGSVLDMLTVGGGKIIGSRRTVDDLLFEKWQYQPKWMDDVPHTPDVIDATLTPVKKELQQLVVDTTTELAVFGVRPSVTYLQTGDLGANSRFGQNLNEDGIVPAIEIASRQNVLGDTNFSLLSGIDELAENYLQQELGPNTNDPFPISLAEGEVTPITDELRANLVDYKNAKDTYANNILDALNADETLVNIVRRLQTEEGVRAGILAFREGAETPLDLNDAYGEVTYTNLKDDFELSLSQSVLPLDEVDADLASGIARINNELEEAATTYINSIRLDLSTPDNRDYVSEGPSGDPLDGVLEAELKVAALIAKRIELELYGAYIDNLFMPAEKVKNSLFVLETKVPKSGDYDLDKFYGTGLWHVNKNTQFQEIMALRIFNKMETGTWGAAFKKMTPEDRWQLSKVYSVLANAAPVDSSAWLPFDNFIRYVQGNPAVKEAMHTQIREMAHLWHLLRRIPGPMKDQFNRFPDEFDYDWRTTLGEMDEVPGPMAEFPALFERPTSLHWHFEELGRIRNEIQSFDEHKRNMDQELSYLTDDPLLNVQRAVSFGPTGTAASMSKLDKVHVNHIIEVLRRKEKAHAIFIQHYLFSPQALEDMAVQAAQQELIEALNATGITDEAMYAQVSPEDLAGASEAIADYEQRRRQWDDPTKEGIEKFRTMPLKPLNLDAGDIILGQYGDSEFAEFVDRMAQFKQMPFQAFLATNEAGYRNLVQDIYATAPANHDIYNPEKIVRGSEDIPAPGVLSPELSTKEGLERLRGHEIISPREMHEAAIDNLLQTMNLEMPRTIKGFDSILQPTSKVGLFARTMFEKSGIHAGFTNSRAYKFFTEKVLEGIVDVSNKNQVIQELQKFFTELERIDVSAIMLKHRGSSTVLESGESLSMLDVALMSYRSKLPTWEGISFDNRPPDKATGKFWADETLIELIETPPAELGAKLDALIDGVLTGFVEAIIPDSKFDGIDFTGPDVRSNMTALLRGELKAVKRMLDESAEATVKRFGNVDFTDIVGTNELGETTFIRKPISPRQVRQSVIMPRVDRWKDLERALTGDWKTVEIAGKTIQVGVTPARAVMRNSMMEVQSAWKAINLLTPRWQMVVNIDSQLRLNAALQTTVGLAKLGPAFDTLQVRWLRNQGIDVHAKVQNELFEALGGFDRIEDINTQLENVRASASVVNFNERRYEDLLREKAVLENREWLSMVDLYMDKGNDMVEFVGDVIQNEYSTLKKVTRLGASSALGLYFGGPVGAATTAGAFSAHSRVSIQKAARRMVAESYGIAARNAAWVSLREAESADIARWLIEQYPDRYGTEQIDASSYGWDDEAWDLTSDTNEIVWPNEELERTLNQPGTTEAKMYAELLRDKNMFVPEDVASFINERIYEEVINRYLSTYAPYIDAVPVKQILTAPFYVNASVATRKVIDARLNEIKRTLSSREQTQIADLTRESIPDAAFDEIFNVDGVDPLIDELNAIAFDPERLNEFEVVSIENFIPYGDLDIPIADQINFLSGEQAQLLINENLSLVDLAKEFRQSLKDRRHAATILAHGAKAVSDYDKVVVQGFQTTDNQIATRFERAAQILIEGGFSTTQVGSTRIDSAFGDVPQMQEINRRNISANPTARTQLQAGTHIQRKREQYQAAHQYDITTPNEQENFIKAYDDTIDRYVSPWGPEGQVASRDFLRQFIRTPDMFRTDDEILRWLNTDGFEAVQDFLPSHKTSENLRELIYKQRYEANSLVPTMLPGFEPVIKKLQAGTTIKWNSDILPALATLQTYVDDFWNAVIQGFKDDLDLRNERGLNETGSLPATTGMEIPEWDTMELLFRAFESGDVMQGVRSPLRDDSGLLLLGRTGEGIQVPASVRRLVLASYNKIYNEASSFDSQMSLTNKLNLMRYAQRRPLVEQIRLMGEAGPIDQNIGERYDGGPIQGEAGLRDFGKTVNDSQYLDNKQTATIWQRLKGSITGPLETLGEVENIMSRGVMFDALYSSDVLRRLEPFRTPDGPGIYHISPKHLNQLQDKSRKWAQVETKNQLYDLSSRTKMEEAMWLISPFFGAWQEVIGRWFSLARENPVFVARGLRAFSVVAAEDENGQTVMVMQLPDIFKDKDTDVIPFIEDLGLFGDLKVLSEMPMDWKLGSISFISANPGIGFQVSFVVGEAILAIPSLDKILGWLIPYGIAEGDNWLQRLVASALPAWIKNIARKGLGDLYLDDERRAATGARVMVDLMTQWNERGDQLPTTEQGKQDFVAEVERITEMIYGMRALRNLIVPTSLIQQSPYYPVIQEYWRVMEEDGPDLADEWLLANNQDLFAATGRTSLTKAAIASTLEGHENYEFHKEDVTEYREISSWIIGQDGPEEVKWEFNRNIRRIEQLEGRVERVTPSQQFMDATAAEGWREWKDFRTKLYAELAQRKKAGLSGAISSHYKLMQLRRDFITENGRKFPAWANEFNDMGNSQVQAKILAGFRHVMKDPAYETRLDGVFIQQYLDLHDGIAAELESRAQTFNSARWEQLSYKENEDLKIVWELGIAKLLMNPDFGNVYDRFFSNIETVSVANSPLREPATLGSAR